MSQNQMGHVERMNGLTGGVATVTFGLVIFLFAMAHAVGAMGSVPGTINGNAIGWPVPTWVAMAWTFVAMVGYLISFQGWLHWRDHR